MSSNTNSSNTSSQDTSSSINSSTSYDPYTITSRGTNSQGNDYDTRTQPGGDAYHYSNADGSYFYKNGDNSTYYNDGRGTETFTAPDGTVSHRWYQNTYSRAPYRS